MTGKKSACPRLHLDFASYSCGMIAVGPSLSAEPQNQLRERIFSVLISTVFCELLVVYVCIKGGSLRRFLGDL